MVAFLADENFKRDIIHALATQRPEWNVLTMQDLGFKGLPDPEVLEWAAQKGRILLTHDKRTMIGFAYQRVRPGQATPGVALVDDFLPAPRAAEELIILVEGSDPDACENQVRYIPLT